MLIIRTIACFSFLMIVAAAVTPAAATTLKYRDKLGRAVTVQTPVKRVVLFETYELLPAIGGFGRVVGLGHHALEDDLILATNPGIARTIPSMGTVWNSNIEAILKVKPDLVVTFKSSNPEAVRFMESKGLNVLVVYPESLAELYEVIRLEGKLFAREQQVERVIREMEGVFRLIRSRVAGIPANQRKRVLLLMMKQTMVAGRTGITQDLFNLINVVNCADSRQNFPEVSQERIVSWNPDLLFHVWYARYSSADLLGNPQLRHVKAIKERQVHKMPRGSTWSPRIAPDALWMAAKAYPERFKDLDVAGTIDRFYHNVYGIPYARVRQHAD